MGKYGAGLITHCGTVWGARRSSYLYVVFTDNYVYIGETRNMPASRWGSHLSKANSSFSYKIDQDLASFGNEPYDGDFIYIGLHCAVIDEEQEGKRKYARTAIEDAIHREYFLNENCFDHTRKLLSRPSRRSERVSLGFDVESYAKHAFSLIVDEYKAFKDRIHHLSRV